MAVLAAAAFVYVTAEIMPVGALPAIAADLQVSEAAVGSLLGAYALVAAVATVPLVRWTSAWPRRRILLFTLASLGVSQFLSALAPSFAVLALGRVLCALTHGLMWSVIAPIGVRLVPTTHAARATAAVYVGTGLALVVGSPLTAAVSAVWGWRTAAAGIGVAAAAALVAARLTVPLMAKPAVDGGSGAAHRPPVRHRRNRLLLTMCVLTLVGVTGHFVSYTFIAVIIRDIVGVHGASLGWLLAGYGVAGLAAMALIARPGDRRPRAAIIGCLAALALIFTVLAALGYGVFGGSTAVTRTVGAVAVVCWGAAATAMPPILQSAAMRHSPDDPDGASGLYVAAFQVGIMAGSLLGGVLYGRSGEPALLTASALLVAGALACVLAGRDLLAGPGQAGSAPAGSDPVATSRE